MSDWGPDKRGMAISVRCQQFRDTTTEDRSAPNKAFIFGLGYTGLAVANQLTKQGWCATRIVRTVLTAVCVPLELLSKCACRTVSGTTRGAEKAAVLEARGISALQFDPENDGCLGCVCLVLLICVSVLYDA